LERFSGWVNAVATAANIPLLFLGTALTAHQSSHFLNTLQWEWRLTQRFHGYAHQLHRVIVRRDTVGRKRAAPAAAVYDRPFATFSHPDSHGFHNAAAIRFPVSGFHVYMQACKAVGAVVAMLTPGSCRNDLTPTDLTGKNIVTGIGFVITFFILFAFVFSIHKILSSKK